MAVTALPAGHQAVEFWCGIDHHPTFTNDLHGISLGYGCHLCYKYDFTPGTNVTPGHAFRARSNGATSAVEIRLRVALAEHDRVSNPDDANAVRIEGDFYGFKHVLPHPHPQAARRGRSRLTRPLSRRAHRKSGRTRPVQGLQLAEVGWTVIRVRIGGLEDVDHARCVIAKDLTKTATSDVIALVAGSANQAKKIRSAPTERNAHPSVVK